MLIPMIETPQSKRIHAYGYEPTSRVLSVQFKNGAGVPGKMRYDYQDIAPEKFAELQAAESKGSWITTNLVNVRTIAFEKVDVSAAAETAPETAAAEG